MIKKARDTAPVGLGQEEEDEAEEEEEELVVEEEGQRRRRPGRRERDICRFSLEGTGRGT
jgi:hypothetical protein